MVDSVDCHFAVAEKCAAFPADVRDVRYSGGEDTVLSSIAKETTSSTLVLAILDPKENGKALMKTLFMHFAEGFPTPRGAYTQFNASFIDESAGDLLHYRCDRLSDIDAVIEEEDGRNRCGSLQASVVQPSRSTFVFSDIRLTLLIWDEEDCGSDLARVAERVATVLGTRLASIFVYFATRDASVVERCLGMAQDLRKVCHTRVFGEDEPVSSQVRLQDVRAWSVFLNEFYHLAPQSEGPYFINLNPRLAAGEKLAHAISPGVSYIVAEECNASHVDVVVFPLCGTKEETGHRSVYSPHCRISYKNDMVYLRPECGITYVNGELLSAETALHPNDRVVLSKEVVLRFVMVTENPPTTSSSRILDWEMCCKEFERMTSSDIRDAERAQLEREVAELKEEYEALQQQLQLERVADDKAWLILNNPPSGYSESFVWHLGWMKTGDSIALGPKGDIALPFLSSPAVITRTTLGFTYTCESVTLKLAHSHHFLNGDSIFSICLQPVTSSERSIPKKMVTALNELEPFSENDLRDFRNSLFELQWSIALLFEFTFPLEKSRPENSTEDLHHTRRAQICTDAILTEKNLKLQSVARIARKMTEAIRMVNSQWADEIGSGTSPTRRDDVEKNGEEGALEELLIRIKDETELSHDLLCKVHQSIGKALMGADAPREGRSRLQSVPPLKTRSLDDRTNTGVRACVLKIKAKCFIASPPVVRRMSATVDVVSASLDPKILWERYLKILTTMVKPHSDVSNAPASKKQNLALALLDVLVVLDYNVRNGYISPEDEENLEVHLASWMAIADTFPEVFKKAAPQKRGTFRSRDAALQRKPTPSMRHTSPASRSTARKPLSRPGTPRSTTGVPSLSPKLKQPTSAHGIEPVRRVTSTVKSPRGLRSLTPTGVSTRTVYKPSSARSTPASPRPGGKSGGGGGGGTPRPNTSTIIHRTLGGSAVTGAARTTLRPGSRAFSPKSPLLRGVGDSGVSLKKKKTLSEAV
ncbi:hypothetical protein DQ04_00311060 [Trypanosoma grayi]|uniref:hypothetical protein n=1 Tax=Trypanosoma grayi TaxID=71804 RepID=UPI0004F4900D|nr:hypothetical protein DQ04_00311060 [Trypanosoma grayi]KEG14770.1 hypothetical protein DQ04_00311060 [Trypanosoma grayi]